jgi:hypothetical protein
VLLRIRWPTSGWCGTSEFLSDRLRHPRSDAWKLLELIGHSPEPVEGRDAFRTQRIPRAGGPGATLE